MTTLYATQPSSMTTSGTEVLNTEKNISKRSNPFGKQIESIKNATIKSVSQTALKIKAFFENNFVNICFTLLSGFALWHGPIRFLCTFILGLTIQKVNYKNHKTLVSSNSLALNILAIIGVILEKTICPVCDPTYYLAPCISGIATSEALYNLLQDYSKKKQPQIP